MTAITPLTRVRSVLFAPAVRPDHLAKLASRGADAVVIDCEDATPANAKADGRQNARRFGPEIAAAGTQVLVRVNAVASEWFADDIRDALGPDLAAIVVPKVEHVADLDRAAEALDEQGHAGLGVMAGLETARGVADARALLGHPRVVAAYFGAEDFIADMGGRRTPGNAEVHHARSACVLAGRLTGVPMVDQVVTDFRNAAAFAAEAAGARDMGYRGKLCIHPGQVELAHEAFTPTAAEIDRARRLVAAHVAASDAGLAAIDFEGQMVDGPLVAQAQQLIELGEHT
ncbi:MAG: CoA ester lyase [Ilumatobacter sp.]|nr:CoA ester lyase [Ilumatobacter sp.]